MHTQTFNLTKTTQILLKLLFKILENSKSGKPIYHYHQVFLLQEVASPSSYKCAHYAVFKKLFTSKPNIIIENFEEPQLLNSYKTLNYTNYKKIFK